MFNCVCDENSVHTRVFIAKLHWVKVKIELEQNILSLISAQDGWMIIAPPRPFYARHRDPVPFVQRVGGLPDPA